MSILILFHMVYFSLLNCAVWGISLLDGLAFTRLAYSIALSN